MKDSYGTYDSRRPEPPYETAGDHDKHGALIELAATWCEAQGRAKLDPMAPIWERRAKMLREGYKPQLVSAPSATAPILEPGESPAKQAAFDAFYAAAKAEIPHNKDGTHSGTFFHALLCGIEAYLQSARTEIAPTPEGLAGMVRNQQDAGADLLRAAHAAAKAEGTPLAEEVPLVRRLHDQRDRCASLLRERLAGVVTDCTDWNRRAREALKDIPDAEQQLRNIAAAMRDDERPGE